MLQLLEHTIEHPVLGPSIHPGINGVPIAESFGQPAPLAAMLCNVQDGIDYAQIGVIHVTALLR
jgi:hypothetical protein